MENYSTSPIERRNHIIGTWMILIFTVSAYINFMFHALCNNGTLNITPDPVIDFYIGYISAVMGGPGLITLSNQKFVPNLFKWGGTIFGLLAIVLGSAWFIPGMVTVIKIVHTICAVAMVAITITMLVKHFLNSRE